MSNDDAAHPTSSLFHKEGTGGVESEHPTVATYPRRRVGSRFRPARNEGRGLRSTLSIPEVAWELGVCAETAYRRAKSGQLPGAFKLGRTWRVSRESFERWLACR